VRGATIHYDAEKQELSINDLHVSAPLRKGREDITVYCDRTSLEIFASGGLAYVPLPFQPKSDNLDLSVQATGGTATLTSMQVCELKSAWK
jgi:sucrose-6-phosphate hydrolase SacC (GH32 family)